MKELIKEYKESLRWVNKAMESANEEDKRLLRQMKSNLKYSIEWMKIGHAPDVVRGIERRAAYERETCMDPHLIEKLSPYQADERIIISDMTKKRLEKVLSCLSKKEKEIYLMAKGNGLTHSQIADYLGISKSNVDVTMYRAKKKICPPTYVS